LSDGSFRDGAKLLEEVRFLPAENYHADLVNEKFNNTGIADSVLQMLKALSEKDAKRDCDL